MFKHQLAALLSCIAILPVIALSAPATQPSDFPEPMRLWETRNSVDRADFDRTPLAEVIGDYQKRQIPLTVRWDALAAAGIGKQTLITLHCYDPEGNGGVPAGGFADSEQLLIALVTNPALRDKLDYDLTETGVILSTRDDLNLHRIFRRYPLGPFLTAPGADPDPAKVKSELGKLFEQMIASRLAVDLATDHDELLVKASNKDQKAIYELLMRLYQARFDDDGVDPKIDKADAAIAEKLEQRIPDVNLNHMNLEQGFELLSKLGHVDITVDWKGLEAAGIHRNWRVYSTHFLNLPLSMDLGMLTAFIDERGNRGAIDYAIGDGAILVFSPGMDAELRLYDLGPLLTVPSDKPRADRTAAIVERLTAIDRRSWHRIRTGPAVAEPSGIAWVRKDGDCLLIQQSAENHRKIADLLAAMPRVMPAPAISKWSRLVLRPPVVPLLPDDNNVIYTDNATTRP